jgi:tetratricopeptide (TPR) repeat protein
LAYWNLDECAAIDSIGRILEARREQVAPYDRYSVARHVAMCRGDHAATYRAARELVRLAPRSEAARVALAQAAIEMSRPRDALGVLKQLDDERDGVHGELRYYFTHCMALHMLGDHRRELKVARQGRRDHPDPTSQLVLLFYGEVRALAAMGRLDELMVRVDESLALPEQAFPTPGRLMLIAASELQAHGHSEAALPMWRRADAWFRSHPAPEKSEASPMRRVTPVWALYGAGHFNEAEAPAARLAAEDPEKIEYQGWLGLLAARLGRRNEAEQIAAQLARREGPHVRGRHTAARAAIAATLGQRERAVGLLEQAFIEGVTYYVGPAQQSLHAEPGFESLRGYPPFEALLRPKG